jgi:hypothetical protein
MYVCIYVCVYVCVCVCIYDDIVRRKLSWPVLIYHVNFRQIG